MSLSDASVVLVHGAWADGSSWAKVIGPLAADGVKVVAAPLPLTSFHDDVAALDRTLERATGSVVLVGHAYAGAVIAATRDREGEGARLRGRTGAGRGRNRRRRFLPRRAPPAGAQARSRQARADLSARGSLRRSLRPTCPRRGSGRAGGGSAANLARLHHGKGGSTAVEGPPGLVPRGGAGSHDRP